jgi:8-oxo-dGTP pyrophosphatase MutT (NUDIX family)
MNPWRTLRSHRVYENPWFSVREDEVVRPDGSRGIHGVVELGASVAIVALNKRREIALVGQWRYPSGRYSIEVPTGGARRGEPVAEAAARELREETGLVATEWVCLGRIDNCNGICDEVAHLFLAQGLEQGAATPDPEEVLSLEWVPLEDAVERVVRGEITESCSVAALLLVAWTNAVGDPPRGAEG